MIAQKKIYISIIIPVSKINDYMREAISYYEKLSFQDFELIILPDESEDRELSENLNIKIIPSGKVGPAEKRDLGANYAQGELLAFTDDDAYPDSGWLTQAVKIFQNQNVAAVGGPAVTPESDSFWQRISGNIYASYLMSGFYNKRYIKKGKAHEDYDLPSVNLIVRKSIFEEVGGFDSTFYPGEDTKLCLDIKKKGYRIMYHPDVLVYHHRRNLFPKHFQQIANYALHRGYFAKKYPETSRKIAYFIPSLFIIGLIMGGILSVFSHIIQWIYFSVIGFYFLLNVILNFKINLLEYFWTVLGIFLSHMTYGLFFIKALFMKELKR